MSEMDLEQRRRFLARLCSMGILRERELIRIHQVAQARRLSPERALVALGLLTADQAAALLRDDAPPRMSMEGLGTS